MWCALAGSAIGLGFRMAQAPGTVPLAATATVTAVATGAAPLTPQPPRTGGPEPLAADVSVGETVRVLRVEDWRVLQEVFGDRAYTMARLGWCEGGLDPTQAVMDVDGTMSYGTFMVKPQYWGEVGTTLEAQARQAARIAAEHPDLWPWAATRNGCREWSR